MIPYTYYIKHLPTGLKYYGSKYGKDADPTKFWIDGGYFTSSRLVKELITEYGKDTFKVKVTKIFNTPQEALLHEYKFLDKVKAIGKSDWLNKNNGGRKFFNVGPDSEITRKKKSAVVRTAESNKKRSEALKGIPKHSEFSKLLSQAQKLRPLDKEMARREKIRKKATGRNHSDETKRTLSTIVSNTKWIKKDNLQLKINVDELPNFINQGWEPGRILTKITCPHCGKTGVNYNITRKHFDKCFKLFNERRN